MNKRRHQRIEVKQFAADISDGVECFSGTVIDISRLGIRLTGIPQSLTNRNNELSILVSAKGKDFKMQVEPKWVSDDAGESKMGLAIVNPPVNWTVFAMIFEPPDEDFWSAGSQRNRSKDNSMFELSALFNQD